jgi:hypothetical protein
MALGLKEGIACFNVESRSELELLSAVAERLGSRAPVSIRINPDVDAGTHEKISTGRSADKFGVSWLEAEAIYARAAELPGLEVAGVDMHLGSQITTLAPFAEAYRLLAELVLRLRREGHDIRHVDIGGGLGVPYRGTNDVPPHPDEYAAMVRGIFDDLGVKLVLEPGRMIAGNAGVLVTRVVHVKPTDTKCFVIVDAAMNDLVRPTLYDAWHDIVPVAEPGERCARCRGRCRRPGVRVRRLSGEGPGHAAGRGGRPAGGDDHRRLWRGAVGHLQLPAADPGGPGEGRQLRHRAPAPDLRGASGPRPPGAMAGPLRRPALQTGPAPALFQPTPMGG